MSITEDITEAYNQLWSDVSTEEKEVYIPEKYQLGIVTDFLYRKGIEYETEHRIYCNPIDIVGVQRNTTIAIELKTQDFKRGIEQACRNAAFVDYSFLSVWESNVTDGLMSRVEDENIGLIAVADSIRFLSPPSKSPKQLYAKENILQTVTTDVRNDPPVQESEQ